MLWAELWPIYAESELETLEAPKTQASMGRHLVRLVGAARVVEMDVAAVRRYRVARKAEITNRGRPPSAKTINNEVILIRRLAKWGARRNLIPTNPLANATEEDILAPVQNVRSNVVDSAPGAHLSLAQFIARADALERALVLVAHSSGMRRRELALLQLGWIDPNERLIHIPAGVAKGRRGAKKARTTLISDDALGALNAYISRRVIGGDAGDPRPDRSCSPWSKTRPWPTACGAFCGRIAKSSWKLDPPVSQVEVRPPHELRTFKPFA